MTDAPQCGRMQRDMNRMNEKAPEFPDIRVDNAIAMPPGRSLNFTEKVGSMTYAG